MATSTINLTVHPVASHIGAEVRGVSLRPDLAPEDVAALRHALLVHRVVFFRDQGHLDTEAQEGVARLFGPLTRAHPTVPGLEGQANVFTVDATRGGRSNHWHTDVTFAAAPPTFSVLRAVQVPEVGGDTLWASTVAAYESLPVPVRLAADVAWARHSNMFDYAARFGANEEGGRREYYAAFTSAAFVADHPVVRVHPETGERAILLGGHAQFLVGLTKAESAQLIRILQDAVVQPEHTVRWRWHANDVAIWDNRTTQHYAIDDYGDFPRLMQRVTTVGEPAVGLDGRTSVQAAGDTSVYLGNEAVTSGSPGDAVTGGA